MQGGISKLQKTIDNTVNCGPIHSYDRQAETARQRLITIQNKKQKKTKGSPERSPEKRGIRPAHTLNPILTIFGMWGGPMDLFLKFEFRVGRSPNFGATGGQKLPFSYSTHIAYTTACCYRTSCDVDS